MTLRDVVISAIYARISFEPETEGRGADGFATEPPPPTPPPPLPPSGLSIPDSMSLHSLFHGLGYWAYFCLI